MHLLPWTERMNYTWKNSLSGFLIYSIGDTIATLITGDVQISRILGMAFLGATLYAVEIPNWFRFVDTWTSKYESGLKKNTVRALLAMAYFNPLWIARHILFIYIITGQWASISWGILSAGGISFITNIPLSVIGNYLIQNKIRFERRYAASAVFSSIMAILYAMGAVWFK